MEYRNLDRSGPKVSAAIDLGVNLIDTADIYQEGRSAKWTLSDAEMEEINDAL